MATKKSNKSLWVMLALIAAIIAVILLLPSCGNRNAKKGAETDAESTTLVKSGDTAPDFTVEMVDGSSVTLGDLKGKVVLLNFWATWCPPCRTMEREVFSRKDVGDFMERHFVAAKYDVDKTTGKELLKRYGSGAIPLYLVFDTQGELLGRIQGAAKPDKFMADLQTILDRQQPKQGK